MLEHPDHPMFIMLAHGCSLGVMAVDHVGRVTSRNHVARAILEERDGIVLVQARPAATGHEEAIAFRKLVAGACARSHDAACVAGTIALSRRPPRLPLTVFVAPLRWPRHAPQMPAALLVMSDPDREQPQIELVLEGLYGFTPTEIDVTMLILDGASAADVAQMRGTSLNTARTHIKRILSKVGVQSQRELVRLLLSGATRDASVASASRMVPRAHTLQAYDERRASGGGRQR